MMRLCSVADWGSQCGDILFDQGQGDDNLEPITGCVASCNFDGCNTAPSLANFSYLTLTAAAVLLTSLLRE